MTNINSQLPNSLPGNGFGASNSRNEYSNLLFQHNGEWVTDTLVIAEQFSKKHKNVISALKRTNCTDEFRRLNFEPSSYISEQNKAQPKFIVNEKGFFLLCMGFTGDKAAIVKEQFVDEWHRLRETVSVFLNDPIIAMRSKQLQLEQDIEETKKELLMQRLDLEAQEAELEMQKAEIEAVKEKTDSLQTRPEWYTISGYANLQGFSFGQSKCSALGRKASKICRLKGIEIDKTYDSRYGRVGVYPIEVLIEVFKNAA